MNPNAITLRMIDRALEFARIAGLIHERFADKPVNRRLVQQHPALEHAMWCEKQSHRLMALALRKPKEG